MATQFITLEEAARRLGIPAEEFKRRLKTEWTNIVPMRDGPNLRFRENQIEELARQLGAASDPGLPLGALDGSEPGSDDFKIGTSGPKTGKIPRAGAAPKPADDPLSFDGSDDDIFSLSSEPGKGGKPSDQSHDSDVRLEAAKPPKDGTQGIPTEEIALDLGGPSSAVIKGGSSAKLSAPKSSANLSASDSGKKLSSESGRNLGKSQNMGDSSEFELSLDADSDDFELQVQSDSSEEVDLGSSPLDEGGRAGKSGVNLRKPADSGIPLDKGRGASASKPVIPPPKPPVDDSDDFELSLEADSDEAKALIGPRSGPKLPVTSDSDSEFELTLDDSSEGGSLGSLEAAALADDDAKGDIFETDFELPVMSEDESGSEVLQVDGADTDLENSDFDLAIDPAVHGIGTTRGWGKAFLLRARRKVGRDRSESIHPTAQASRRGRFWAKRAPDLVQHG